MTYYACETMQNNKYKIENSGLICSTRNMQIPNDRIISEMKFNIYKYIRVCDILCLWNNVKFVKII